ncbi:C_GCAxxG_C_C family protein [bacterium]|nr:C_GCAxxG_C_C family protein [bacterium]
MGSRADRAKELFEQGYNCAQATLGAFSDLIGLDFDLAMKLSSSFGGGMGKLREVCGAVSAMFMVAGVLKGYSSPETGEIKAQHYKLIQELAKKFKEENGSIICAELLGLDKNGNKKDECHPELVSESQGSTLTPTLSLGEGEQYSYIPSERTEQYYKTRPCSMLVYSAARIIEEELVK